MRATPKIIIFLNCSHQIGGAERSLEEIASNIDKNKYNFTVLTPKGSYWSKKLRSKHPLKHIEVKSIGKRDLFSLNTYISIVKINFEILRYYKSQKNSVLYCNTWKGLIYCIISKLVVNAKVICHCRDNIGFFQRILILVLSNRVIAVSGFIKNQLLINKDRIALIPNSVNIDPDTNLNQRELLNIPQDKIIIGNIGQNVRWKNQEEFIKIAAKLSSICENVFFILVIFDIGAANPKRRRELEDAIDKNGLRDQLRILPFQETIFPTLSAIDIYLHTAIKEPFGRTIIEAMLMGCTVVASNHGGPGGIIENGQTGILIDKWDDHSIEKIKQLVSNKAYRDWLGENARKTVFNNYNSKKVIKQIEFVLDSL